MGIMIQVEPMGIMIQVEPMGIMIQVEPMGIMIQVEPVGIMIQVEPRELCGSFKRGLGRYKAGLELILMRLILWLSLRIWGVPLEGSCGAPLMVV